MNIDQSLISDIKSILTAARNKAYTAINFAMVEAYWHIGRRIVLEEQRGMERADYGTFLIKELSKQLTNELGAGFTLANLKNFRQFYLIFSKTEIGKVRSLSTVRKDEERENKSHSIDNEQIKKSYAVRSFSENDESPSLPPIFRKELTWTHYRLIMRVENPSAREYYITEAAASNWSSRVLARNINTFYYERILSSNNIKDVLVKAGNLEKQSPADFIKDPYIFEFLNIPEPYITNELKLEEALIDNLKHFLLELGKGFSFVKRQYRINTETKSFSIDLVFYNYILKCFALFDLKTGELSHQDVGQMDMYVKMFDDLQRLEGDNPTIGVILCTDKDETIVKYSVLNGSEQLFATKYKLYLPTEEELIAEIEREKLIIQEKLKSQNP